MNRRTRIYLLVALGAMAVMATITAQLGEDDPRNLRISTFNPGPQGTRALYETLRATGTPVRRWQRSYAQLPEDASVLIIPAPLRGITRNEWTDDIEPWVAAGHTVILASGMGEVLPFSGGAELALARELRYGTAPIEPWRAKDDPDGAENEADDAESLSDLMARVQGADVTLPPVLPSALTPRGAALVVPPFDPLYAYTPAAAPLYAGDGGPYGWHQPIHNGRVILSATPAWLGNARIRDGQNLEFLLRILAAYRGDGVVLFDERAQGYAVGDVHLRDLITQPAWTAALLQLAFVGVWYGVSNGRRFGKPIPVVRRTFRSTLEYVDAMANLYRRAALHRPTLSAHWQSFRVDLAKRYGIAPRASLSVMRARLLEAAPALEPQELDTALAAVREALRAKDRLSNRALVRAARAIDALRRKVL